VVGLLLSAAARHVAADLAFLDDAEETLLTDEPDAPSEATNRRGGTRIGAPPE
jgi:hypothetical protein